MRSRRNGDRGRALCAAFEDLLVRLDGTLGMEAILGRVERHPGETPVPGVGEVAFAGRGVTTSTDAVTGTAMIVCAADDGGVEPVRALVVR